MAGDMVAKTHDHQGPYCFKPSIVTSRHVRSVAPNDCKIDPVPSEIQSSRIIAHAATGEWLIADKGFDNDNFRAALAAAEIDVVIPPREPRKAEIAYDQNAYGLRHRIECFINKIKHYRRIATRCPGVDT
jgi:hypothetical protein